MLGSGFVISNDLVRPYLDWTASALRGIFLQSNGIRMSWLDEGFVRVRLAYFDSSTKFIQVELFSDRSLAKVSMGTNSQSKWSLLAKD